MRRKQKAGSREQGAGSRVWTVEHGRESRAGSRGQEGGSREQGVGR